MINWIKRILSIETNWKVGDKLLCDDPRCDGPCVVDRVYYREGKWKYLRISYKDELGRTILINVKSTQCRVID
jgi:hypothetical protein